MNKQVHVLIVEDDEKLSRLYTKTLNHVGFSTRHATTIDDAIFQTKKFDPDVICLDWQLGEQVGESLLAYIAAMDEQNVPKVVLASGRITKNDLLAFTNFVNLIDVVLMKPVAISNLAATVKKLADDAKTRRQAQSQVEVETMQEGVLQMVWQGRLNDTMIARLGEDDILGAKVLILDLSKTHLEIHPPRQLAGDKWKEKAPARVLVVHYKDEMATVRRLLEPLLQHSKAEYFVESDAALKAALEQANPTTEKTTETKKEEKTPATD